METLRGKLTKEIDAFIINHPNCVDCPFIEMWRYHAMNGSNEFQYRYDLERLEELRDDVENPNHGCLGSVEHLTALGTFCMAERTPIEMPEKYFGDDIQ